MTIMHRLARNIIGHGIPSNDFILYPIIIQDVQDKYSTAFPKAMALKFFLHISNYWDLTHAVSVIICETCLCNHLPSALPIKIPSFINSVYFPVVYFDDTVYSSNAFFSFYFVCCLFLFV